MARIFLNIIVILDQVARNNKAWYTKDRDYSRFFFKIIAEQRKKEEE